jgi:hypothetical protein
MREHPVNTPPPKLLVRRDLVHAEKGDCRAEKGATSRSVFQTDDPPLS